MLPFLQSNLSLISGVLLTLLVIGVRAASSDSQFRKELGGALGFLLTFLTLRVVEGQFGEPLHPRVLPLLRVAWMFTFAFGSIRAGMSLAVLTVTRLGIRTPPPKILRDVVEISLYVIAVVPILRAELAIDLTSLLATSAIVSVVLGLAMQDTLGNLFAGLSLQLERPYQVGDWVTIKEITGRVVQVAWRATRLETSRKEIITLPNNVCSKEAVRNYSKGGQPVGMDLSFHGPYDRAPNEVKEAVLEVLEQVPLSRLSRGDYFGEMSLLTGEPRTATVVALTDVVLLELGRPVFARLFEEHPELAPKLSGMLAHRRMQLDAAMTASGETLPGSEEVDILSRLKNIFRLN